MGRWTQAREGSTVVDGVERTPKDPADIAYRIVKESREPLTTRALLDRVLDELGLEGEERAARAARVYTAISLDHRLVAVDRVWLTREQAPKPKAARGGARVAAIAPRKLKRETIGDEEEELEEVLEEPEEVEDIEAGVEETEGEWD
jgi:DNA-directed RNA polymerase delta subunit